ncbi:MAG: DUF4197 domain-containing protein [Pontibacterium sp.]
MRKTLTCLPLVTALSFTIAPLATAGFGDFLKKLEDSGKEVLEQNLGGDRSTASLPGTLDIETLVQGLKEALEVGSRRAIETISQDGGYLNNAKIRVPIPESIDKTTGLLRKLGMGSQVDQFEASMNRAAEKAAPQATELIVSALKEMTFEDARKIYDGPDNAATEYFREKTSTQLTTLFKPSIQDSMNEVGVTRYYGVVAKEAKKLPYVGQSLDVNLEDHVTDKALAGLFTVLAEEEKKIRENPTARTTELLKKVFQ